MNDDEWQKKLNVSVISLDVQAGVQSFHFTCSTGSTCT